MHLYRLGSLGCLRVAGVEWVVWLRLAGSGMGCQRVALGGRGWRVAGSGRRAQSLWDGRAANEGLYLSHPKILNNSVPE